MEFDEEGIFDLARLAVDRCERAMQTVTQLVDKDTEVFTIGMSVMCSMLAGAVDQLSDGMEKQNGKRPAKADALRFVIQHLLEGVGATCEIKVFNVPKEAGK